MPRIQEDFSAISSSFEPLPAGDYRVRVTKIEEGETRDNKLPQVTIELTVLEGALEKRTMTDFVTLKTNKGEKNKIGLGRIKAYAEAILGEERANDTSGIDTDELNGGECIIVVKDDTYEQDGVQKHTTKIKKVLPVG